MLIEYFRSRLLKEGRTSLDTRWRPTPCGSISKIETFLNLLAAEHFTCAVLCDYAEGQQKREVQRLRETGSRVSADVLTADQYAGKTEADLEDLLGDEAYAFLVNGCYGLTGSHALVAPKPAAGKSTGRILKAAEDHMRMMPPGTPEFKHPEPPDYLMRLGLDAKLPGLDEAMDRFETLFKTLNQIIDATPAAQTADPPKPGRRTAKG
jgi:hypothetical protein